MLEGVMHYLKVKVQQFSPSPLLLLFIVDLGIYDTLQANSFISGVM